MLYLSKNKILPLRRFNRGCYEMRRIRMSGSIKYQR